MKRLVTALALAGSTAVALYASSAPATAASTSAPTAAKTAKAANTSCDPTYYDSTDQRIHVFCTGPGFAELHIKCWPATTVWRDAGVNIVTPGARTELSMGCGIFPILDSYAEIHR
ncbi:hypothetical protein ACIBG4_38105 [Nonomuraea sp. NPDC050383]|uniref:hypothetical protein n=1 Tax=Nonomuraea sp. NPDC050383 TaxID=3364362 RepID=UPI0037B41ABF